MIRTTSLLTITAFAIGLSAGAAAAEVDAASTKVSLKGKTNVEIAAEIYKAAREVCSRELGDSALAYGEQGYCVKDTASRAMAAVEKIRSAQAAQPEMVASAAVTR